MELKLKPLRVPHEETRLTNGLQVVVHEDASSPIVAVHLMYHAGSKNERSGITGLAHLLEHLLFEGSENCPKGEFDRLLERVGGTNNGSTWLDRTNYYEVVPNHAVEIALWLERERMAHFLPVLDEEMLEIQRSVVINERKQAYENRPYGLAYERLQQLLFPEDHPYSWPTIGYTRDLEAITLEDARSFYTHFYAPDNAVLVLAGDISIGRGFALAEKYFGDLRPQGNGTRDQFGGAGGSIGGRRDILEDRVSFPRIYHAWAVPPYGSDEWVQLDVLSYLLTDGDSSRLHRALMRDAELAQDVDSYLYPTQLTGIFGIVTTARSGVGADQLESAADAVLERVISGGVTPDEVAGAVRRARRDHLASLANVENRAEELAYAATVLGDPASLQAVLNRYASVTPEQVRTVAGEYLKVATRATVVVVPTREQAHES
jgi:zinc protease